MLLCGRTKPSTVQLKIVEKPPVTIKLKEEKYLSTLTFDPIHYDWDRQIEKSEEEKEREKANEFQRQKDNEEEEIMSKVAQREEKVFEEKVYAQEQEMKLLHAQIAELQDKMAQAKRHMLITAIKNETIKKMIQKDQEEFLAYASYKFQDQQ